MADPADQQPEEHRVLAQRLRPGRHGLPREEVIASQRQRLLGATAIGVAEVGYGELTIGDIARRAGVSRVTFYELFEGKADVLRAAVEDAFAALRAVIAAACAARPTWPENLIAAVEATIGFAHTSPARTGLLTLDAVGIEPELSGRVRGAYGELAQLLRAASAAAEPGAEPRALPALTEQALIGGAASVIAARLCEGGVQGLAELAPHLAQMLLVPYLGAAEAAASVNARPSAA